MDIVTAVVTQEDQDNADDQKRRESMHALIQTWLESLQLISLIVSKILSPLLVCPNYKLMSNYLHCSDNVLCRNRSYFAWNGNTSLGRLWFINRG